MARRIGKLALLGTMVGGCAVPLAAMAQQDDTVKQGFQCRIELPMSGEELFTFASSRVCAPTFISVNCRDDEVDLTQDPADTYNDDIECEIDGSACGEPDPDPTTPEFELLPATLATIKIDDQGVARLSCVLRLEP